ncbi:hypothetical protein [Thermogemmatispora onikobensis]|uniref:hypothetical protein n=1 Tax=Thermogemmatispora onikobensis TaxID=732234 RepID=UPI000852D15B|nr:hypothetical protein [Thermogemmatispora onikobensis]
MNEDMPGPDQPPQQHGQPRSARRIYRPPATEHTTVACSTCGAIFAPSHLHPELRLASPAVLEAALMSMSHFCFRCRRAACPECWDHVHRICGACVAELGLPFRREVPPLEGAFFAPPPPAPSSTSTSSDPCTCQINQSSPTQEPLLTCLQAGRFRTLSSPSAFIAAIETVEMQNVQPLPPTSPGPAAPAAHPSPSTPPTDNTAATESKAIPPSLHLPANEQPPLLPPPASSSTASPFLQQTTPSHNLASPTRLTPRTTSKVAQDQPAHSIAQKEAHQPRASGLPLWLSLPLLALLTLALAAILLAELSAAFNALLLRAIHIDIRGTINLFLQWIQWFH